MRAHSVMLPKMQVFGIRRSLFGRVFSDVSKDCRAFICTV